MSTLGLLGLGVSLWLAGALVSLLVGRWRRVSGWLSVAFLLCGGLLVAAVVVRTFADGPAPEAVLLRVGAIDADLVVRVDYLSALFLAITSFIAVLTALYSVEYMSRYRHDSVAKYFPLLLVLFVSIAGVVTTADFLSFLVCWELMTVASFFLVIFERERREAVKAGLKYFVVNQAATLGMLAGGLVLWSMVGSFHFAALRDAFDALLGGRAALAHLVILLFFLAFATKAGVLPMGSWLPDAYPAAPSGATAAFGGTMTKLGIYGLLRVFLEIVPLSPATRDWGLVVALAGVGSLFVGTLTALKQDDVKRLMSFHVIGQVGYMFLGIGMGLFLLARSPVLGMLGLLAGVFHMLNHSLYKSCLFLGAGAVYYRAGSRSLSEVGGLGRYMPVTALCAGTAALAIAGVPPLNGFASKWMIYATAVKGGELFPWLIMLAIVAIFISLVTLASFIKYLAGAFMGTRSAEEPVREVPAAMLVPQVVLALTCVAFGLVPLVPLGYVHAAVTGLLPGAGLPGLAAALGDGPGLQMAVGVPDVAVWKPLPVAAALALLGLFSYYVIQRGGGATVRDVPAWTCGEEEEPTMAQYPASSFYVPFKHAFRGIYPQVRVTPPALPAWVRRVFDVDRWLHLPTVRMIGRGASGLSRTHVGVPQVYLLWIVLGAVAVVAILLALIG